MRYSSIVLLLLLLLPVGGVRAEAVAVYLANAGLMVTDGDVKILFDPLFRNSYGRYQLLPGDMERALIAGEPPFDGVDAVFVSHHHGDHFSAVDILDYLRRHPSIQLYAPQQAVESLRYLAKPKDAEVLTRITALTIDYGDPAITLTVGPLLIDAFHIPHSGWPERKPEVQNIAFRVTLDEETTVLHLGDADTDDRHFANDAALWESRATHAAFPPYWFFTSSKGQAVLRDRLKPRMAIGVHVPEELPAAYSKGLEDADLFRVPGESRKIDNSR